MTTSDDDPTRSGPTRSFASDEERSTSFARRVDARRRELEERIGDEDVAYIESVRAVSSSLEVAGRALIQFSMQPVSFGVGVLALSVRETLELVEIGHTVLHGTCDRLQSANDFRSTTFRWKAPVGEESWRAAHNLRHHQYANIAGRDPDLDFGGLRLSRRVTLANGALRCTA